jgi:hypothetical protein
MPRFARSFSLQPTGADSTYRRFDYLRGSLVTIVLAAVRRKGCNVLAAELRR